MHLQVDNEFQQVKIKDLIDKFNVTILQPVSGVVKHLPPNIK